METSCEIYNHQNSIDTKFSVNSAKGVVDIGQSFDLLFQGHKTASAVKRSELPSLFQNWTQNRGKVKNPKTTMSKFNDCRLKLKIITRTSKLIVVGVSDRGRKKKAAACFWGLCGVMKAHGAPAWEGTPSTPFHCLPLLTCQYGQLVAVCLQRCSDGVFSRCGCKVCRNVADI